MEIDAAKCSLNSKASAVKIKRKVLHNQENDGKKSQKKDNHNCNLSDQNMNEIVIEECN